MPTANVQPNGSADEPAAASFDAADAKPSKLPPRKRGPPSKNDVSAEPPSWKKAAIPPKDGGDGVAAPDSSENALSTDGARSAAGERGGDQEVKRSQQPQQTPALEPLAPVAVHRDGQGNPQGQEPQQQFRPPVAYPDPVGVYPHFPPINFPGPGGGVAYPPPPLHHGIPPPPPYNAIAYPMVYMGHMPPPSNPVNYPVQQQQQAGPGEASTKSPPDVLAYGPGGYPFLPMPLHTGAHGQARLLATPNDPMKLSHQQCFVRTQIEAFATTPEDLKTHVRGRNKAIVLGQVGIRCIHCRSLPFGERGLGSVYFPASVSGVYQAAQNMQKYHLRENCSAIPPETQERLKVSQSKSSLGGGKQYWTEAAMAIGLVDTPQGIRFLTDATQPPSGKNVNEESSFSHAVMTMLGDNPPDTVDLGMVCPEDRAFVSDFVYVLYAQLRPCRMAKCDRVGYRKDHTIGLPGLECKHCEGESRSGRFFRSTTTSLAKNENTYHIYAHLKRCDQCPDDLRSALEVLKRQHEQESGNLKRGWKKTFFGRVLKRLLEACPEDEQDANVIPSIVDGIPSDTEPVMI